MRNPIQFAVVREDPEVERRLWAGAPPARALLVASGGCTALSLQAAWPDAELTLVDPNPAQLELVRRKVAALAGGGVDGQVRRAFGVGTDDPRSLSQCGNFESLFRGLRRFVEELVASPAEIEAWFEPGADRARVEAAFARPFWPVAFEMFFCDALLEAMFGAEATQHAPRGSYPAYFRQAFERGLVDPGAADNPFLHHVFLGRYLERPSALPRFLVEPARRHDFAWIEGPFEAVPSFAPFDFVDLSNVMDWMPSQRARALVARLGAELRPGAAVLWRQLNNDTDRVAWFGGTFAFDPVRDRELQRSDRSLFYSSIHVATRR